MTAKVISCLIITQIFQRLPNKVRFMISTCKCYITLHLSKHCLPDWIMILMKTWLPLKPSALPACPVIENSCSKPSGFVNFQIAPDFPYNGRFVLLYYRFSAQHSGGNIIGNGMTKQQDGLFYRQLAFVLIFPKNSACAHIWQAKQKQTVRIEKHVESGEQLVNTHQGSHSL